MAYHHLALATRDMKAIDHFYREVMGFDLKKVEIGPTPVGGWAKHFFYEIEPDRFIAFWELHGEPYEKPFETGLVEGGRVAGMGQPHLVLFADGERICARSATCGLAPGTT